MASLCGYYHHYRKLNALHKPTLKVFVPTNADKYRHCRAVLRKSSIVIFILVAPRKSLNIYIAVLVQNQTVSRVSRQ